MNATQMPTAPNMLTALSDFTVTTKGAAMNAADQQSTQAAPAQFSPLAPITINFPALNEGEKFIGVIISADGSKRELLILLPGDSDAASWQEQMDWAASIGGVLPDRVESALLFATMKVEFKSTWYWLREQHAYYSDCAWYQLFTDGYQSYQGKSASGRARAVRKLTIQ